MKKKITAIVSAVVACALLANSASAATQSHDRKKAIWESTKAYQMTSGKQPTLGYFEYFIHAHDISSYGLETRCVKEGNNTYVSGGSLFAQGLSGENGGFALSLEGDRITELYVLGRDNVINATKLRDARVQTFNSKTEITGGYIEVKKLPWHRVGMAREIGLTLSYKC